VKADVEGRIKKAPFASKIDKAATWTLRLFMSAFSNGDYTKGFIENEKCTRCGICAKVCPTGNISVVKAAGVAFCNCK
jgi:ferredoxin